MLSSHLPDSQYSMRCKLNGKTDRARTETTKRKSLKQIDSELLAKGKAIADFFAAVQASEVFDLQPHKDNDRSDDLSVSGNNNDKIQPGHYSNSRFSYWIVLTSDPNVITAQVQWQRDRWEILSAMPEYKAEVQALLIARS